MIAGKFPTIAMARILVIDDEKPICSLCAHVLRANRHAVAVAHDGFEGLTMFRADPTDIVIVDLLMPHGGLQVIRVLRATFPDVPIIAMSGFGLRRLEIAVALGASRILSKPFTPQELVAVVAELVPSATRKMADGVV